MKKEVLIVVSAIFLLAIASPLNAQEFVENGRQCLNDQIDEKSCSDLSLEENIYTTMATGRCSEELESRSKNNCWGSPSCNAEKTAKAIVALKSQGVNTDKYENWILNNSQTEKNLKWLLQIDSSGAACTINSDGDKYEVKVNKNDKLTETKAHQCFSLSDSKYRIEINNDCYSQEFSVSCNKSYSTTTFFESRGSNIVHVLESTEDSAGQENQTKSIKTKCVANGASCSYEGTLWSALALSLSESKSNSQFMPYLIGSKENNPRSLPDSLLYYITDNENYRNNLIQGQEREGYWFVSGDRYYDTALALFAYGSETDDNKKKAINWTKNDQGSEGCWNDKDIADTAFMIHALDPKSDSSQEDSQETQACEGNGYCMKRAACKSAGGDVKSNYTCIDQGFDICCSKKQEKKSCSDVGGSTCSSNEVCEGTKRSDIETSTGFCCAGTCKKEQTTQEKQEYYKLTAGSCNSVEILPSKAGPDHYSSKEECEANISTEENEGGFFKENLVLILILSILGIGIILGIMYRKKIINKINGMFGKGSPSRSQRPSGPRKRPGMKQPARKRVVKKNVPRKRPPQRKRPSRSGGDDEVFNKLKEMGRK